MKTLSKTEYLLHIWGPLHFLWYLEFDKQALAIKKGNKKSFSDSKNITHHYMPEMESVRHIPLSVLRPTNMR